MHVVHKRGVPTQLLDRFPRLEAMDSVIAPNKKTETLVSVEKGWVGGWARGWVGACASAPPNGLIERAGDQLGAITRKVHAGDALQMRLFKAPQALARVHFPHLSTISPIPRENEAGSETWKRPPPPRMPRAPLANLDLAIGGCAGEHVRVAAEGEAGHSLVHQHKLFLLSKTTK